MGTKVQNLPGYYSMRDLNEESSSCSWPLFYGDKPHTNGQYYNEHQPRAEGYSVYGKDFVKQMILEHEATFKKQVSELHRLYDVQKSLMDEVKSRELHKYCSPTEASFSADRLASQISQKWHYSGFPMTNSTGAARPYISGVECVHSSFGSAQGNCKQAGLFPLSNGSSSKDVVLESRPSKARSKMLFDLQIPADQYLDTEESEKLSDENMHGTTHEKENNVKLFCGNGGKGSSHEDISQCDKSSRTKNGLADLNKPVQVEEQTNAYEYGHLSHYSRQGAGECPDRSAKEKSQFFNLPGDGTLDSYRRSDGQAQNNEYLENIASGRGWIPSVLLQSGQVKSNGKPVPQVLKLEKSILPSQLGQDGLKKACEPPSNYLTNLSKADLWRDKTVYDLEVSERSHEMSMNKHPESVASSRRVGLSAASPSSNLSKTWSHLSSSGEMPCTLNQKLMSFKTSPCLNAPGTLRKNFLSGQSDGIFGDSWPVNVNSKSNPGYRSDVPAQGFYHGSSSGSQEPSANISSISYNYLKHNNDYRGVSEHLINNGSAKYNKGSNCNNPESGKDKNLNRLFSSGSSNNYVSQSGSGIMDTEQQHGEHLAVLPWLKPKSTFKNEMLNTGRTGKEPSEGFMHTPTSASCSTNFKPRTAEAGDGSNTKKILGVPIFDTPHVSPKKESSSFSSPSVSIPLPSDAETYENNKKKWVLDINLPCDVDVLELEQQIVTENIASGKQSSTREANTRTQIDLNLSMSEDEESLAPISTSRAKMKPEIDLEAPAVPEIEEEDAIEEKHLETPPVSARDSQDMADHPEDELLKCAAEAIVTMSSLSCDQVDEMISSQSESLMVDPLNWFVDVVLDTSLEKHGERNKEESASEGMDYFECMTLKLTDTKEDDYMPKPLVPENLNLDEPGPTSLPTRTRRGPARRGRQQRDFQRDILPGIASLSRHEVTEDLQTFGGLMRATGHPWHLGLARRSSSRNRCGRGRRRLQVMPSSPPPPVANNEPSTSFMQQHLNNVEVVGLEDRRLTGWGKTTRRPRRQRCPAGNPLPILLT